MARSHVVLGAASWVVVAPLLHLPPFDLVDIGLAVAGSLLPDVDHPGSWVGRRVRPVSTAVAAVLGHRGLTHSALAVLALAWALVQAGYHRPAVSALALGYMSHLVADMLTPQGLRLAWPWRRVWRLPLCRTGSPMEALIVLLAAALAVWLALRGGLARLG